MQNFGYNDEKKVPRVTIPHKNAVEALSTGRAVVLTPEGIEYEAIRAYLSNPYEEVHRGTVYERGTFRANKQEWGVSIVEIGEGGATASFEAERAISYFQPDVILFISTASGVQDVRPGDVVSATKVYGYEAGRSETTFQARPAAWSVSYEMEQRARAEVRKSLWLQRIKGNAPLVAPRVVLKPIASGEKEIASTLSQTFEILRLHYEDAVAVERGGYGVLQAARANKGINALVVCGIVEMIQEKGGDSEDRRKIAAQHASAFAFEVLARLEGKTPSQQPPLATVAPLPDSVRTVEVFYSYVDKDKELVERLRQHLVMLRRSGQMSEWDAGSVEAGGALEEHLHHLETAHLILLLISQDYIASEQHYNEVTRAIERSRAGDAKVVPILLRQTNGLEATDVGTLQMIPRNKKAINQSRDMDQALKDIAQEIEKIVKLIIK